jgi:predicted secreted hydrolase
MLLGALTICGKSTYHTIDELDKVDHPIDDPQKALLPNPDVGYEWWYFTGHIDGRRQYGYEFCIFKIHPNAIHIGPVPFKVLHKRPFLVLHGALTDKETGEFFVVQKSGLVQRQQYSKKKLMLKLGNAMIRQDRAGEFKISLKSKKFDIDLKLNATKPLQAHFDKGFTSMYPGHRTYYLSHTRLDTEGKLRTKGSSQRVAGQSWFDHQKLNVVRQSPLRGWDWFSIQLDDGSELMIYGLRKRGGSRIIAKGGSYITRSGKLKNLYGKDISIRSKRKWTSQKTGITYPSSWDIIVKDIGVDLKVSPVILDQEVTDMASTPLCYWEGPCDIRGKKGSRSVKGKGYAELVGYDKRLKTKISQALVL